MTTIRRQAITLLTSALVGCVSGISERDARQLADDALHKAVASEPTPDAKVEFLKSGHFPQGWQFEYRTNVGGKAVVYAVLVSDDKHVEVSRQAPD